MAFASLGGKKPGLKTMRAPSPRSVLPSHAGTGVATAARPFAGFTAALPIFFAIEGAPFMSDRVSLWTRPALRAKLLLRPQRAIGKPTGTVILKLALALSMTQVPVSSPEGTDIANTRESAAPSFYS